MVLNYQRWTPLECNCSFQQEFNSDTGEFKLLFAYNICEKHRPIAENQKSKDKLKKEDFDKMKNDTLKAINDSLAVNRQKNLSGVKKTKDIPDVENALLKHEVRVREEIQEALEQEPHSLSCGDVYTEVVKVMKEENDKRITQGG